MNTIKAILFDWGDTLMIDYPQYSGKMCDWPKATAIEGAQQALARLSTQYSLYLATNAQDSTLAEIETALQRADVLQYLSGVFCKSETGLDKANPLFYPTIATHLALKPEQILMVGDSLIKDITPAKLSGLQTAWYTQSEKTHHNADLQFSHFDYLVVDKG